MGQTLSQTAKARRPKVRKNPDGPYALGVRPGHEHRLNDAVIR